MQTSFINSQSQSNVSQGFESVDCDIQSDYQLSTELEFSSDDDPSRRDSSDLLSEEVLVAWHELLNGCQTQSDAMEFYAALDTLSSQQRQQFELSVPESSWAWLWNLPEVLEPVLTPESESVEEPPEESPTQDPIWSEVVLEVGSAIPILKSGAGVAAVISLPDRTLVISAYLGDVSKEVANYQALIAGLKRAIQFGCKRLVVKISSFTLCRAFTGFTPQKPDSVALHQQALALLAQLASYRFEDQKRTIAEGFALSAVQEHHLAAES